MFQEKKYHPSYSLFPSKKKNKQPTHRDFLFQKKNQHLDTFQIHEAVDVVSWWIQKAPGKRLGREAAEKSPIQRGAPEMGEIQKKKKCPYIFSGYGKSHVNLKKILLIFSEILNFPGLMV